MLKSCTKVLISPIKMLVSHLILAIYAHILGTHAGLSSHFTLETSILAHFLHILAGFHFCIFFGQIGRVSHLMSSLLHARACARVSCCTTFTF